MSDERDTAGLEIAIHLPGQVPLGVIRQFVRVADFLEAPDSLDVAFLDVDGHVTGLGIVVEPST
ncbi:hypothetical protein [Cellulomonas sp. PhB150]|uniref:hypothetical protein n=1 Tax=Cellulomonas sp. PhB150 TaxID=2485188 RepID=UPI000F49CBF4|nr:hypothetical protein [Cellulomonas sp. PhB150]